MSNDFIDDSFYLLNWRRLYEECWHNAIHLIDHYPVGIIIKKLHCSVNSALRDSDLSSGYGMIHSLYSRGLILYVHILYNIRYRPDFGCININFRP